MKRCAVAVAATASSSSPSSSSSSALNLASLRCYALPSRPSTARHQQRWFVGVVRAGPSRFEKLLIAHGRQLALLEREENKIEKHGEEVEQLLRLATPKGLYDHRLHWERRPPNPSTDPADVHAYVYKRAERLSRMLRKCEDAKAAIEKELDMLRLQLGDSMGSRGIEGGVVATRGSACPFLHFVDQKGGRWSDKDTVTGCARTFMDPHALTGGERIKLKRKAEVSYHRRQFAHRRHLEEAGHQQGPEARAMLKRVADATEKMVSEAVLRYVSAEHLAKRR